MDKGSQQKAYSLQVEVWMKKAYQLKAKLDKPTLERGIV